MRDGNISEVKVKPASAELIIEEVTEGHRGKYRCIVKNEFGDQESRPAELIIGMYISTQCYTLHLWNTIENSFVFSCS